MTKREFAVGAMILIAFICTLDIVLFDQLSERLSAVIGEMAKTIAPAN